MAATIDYINSLKQDKSTLVNNLIEKGVDASENETFTTLVPKVLDIQSGGDGTVEKGIIINSFDANGYATDVTIVGITEIPSCYLCGYDQAGSFNTMFSNIENVTFAQNTTIIGTRTFFRTKLALKELPPTLTALNNYCFYNCALEITEIPAGITYLPPYSFYGNSKIKELTILGAVTSIEQRVFYNCSALSKLIIPNVTSVPYLGTMALNSSTPIASGNGYVYVPDSLVDSFKVATNWSAYANQIKPISEL